MYNIKTVFLKCTAFVFLYYLLAASPSQLYLAKLYRSDFIIVHRQFETDDI